MSLIDFKFLQRLSSPSTNDNRIALGDRLDTAFYKLQSQLDTIKAAGEPTGFLDRFQSVISFNDSTRVFTITPLSSSYLIFLKGFSFVINSSRTVTIPNSTGLHFIYFDADTGNLVTTTTFSEDIITKHAYVSVIYYRADTSQRIYFADERHGIAMDSGTHIHFHTAFGAQYVNGLALNNIIADGSTSLDTSCQFGVDNGVIRDEDIKITITDGLPQDIAPIGKYPILYRLGSDTNWFRTTIIDNFPVLTSSKATYPNGGGLPAYNYKSGTDWLLGEVLNNDYFLMHVLATNDVDYPIQIICGGKYATLSQVRDGAITEFKGYSGLPFTEFVLIATVIFQSNATHTNTPKSIIVSTQDGFPYVDWRKTTTFNVGGTGSTQNAIQTVAGNTGSYTAQTPTDTINIVGSDGVSTSVSGNTLTITANTGTQRTFGFFIS